MNYFSYQYKKPIGKAINCLFILTFLNSLIFPQAIFAQHLLNLPQPKTILSTGVSYAPIMITGITIHPENPFQFDFIIDKGEEYFREEDLNAQINQLVKYFLASLTVPQKEMWVNLSPYEKNRIIPDSFGQTEMGRDLLAQDYVLKQLTASLINPESKLGEEFWARIYQKAQQKYGTTDIPMNTFNKIWIIPDKAKVYVNKTHVVIIESHLKVLLEEDYLALESNVDNTQHGLGNVKKEDVNIISGISSNIVREILIPEIEREVNEGKLFVNLRQIYHSMILATWYKENLKKSLLAQVYADQNKIEGVQVSDKEAKQKIYEQYLRTFEKGTFNYVKEEYDPDTQELISRKYFSGGVSLDQAMITSDGESPSIDNERKYVVAKYQINPLRIRDSPSLAEEGAIQESGWLSRGLTKTRKTGILTLTGLLFIQSQIAAFASPQIAIAELEDRMQTPSINQQAPQQISSYFMEFLKVVLRLLNSEWAFDYLISILDPNNNYDRYAQGDVLNFLYSEGDQFVSNKQRQLKVKEVIEKIFIDQAQKDQPTISSLDFMLLHRFKIVITSPEALRAMDELFFRISTDGSANGWQEYYVGWYPQRATENLKKETKKKSPDPEKVWFYLTSIELKKERAKKGDPRKSIFQMLGKLSSYKFKERERKTVVKAIKMVLSKLPVNDQKNIGIFLHSLEDFSSIKEAGEFYRKTFTPEQRKRLLEKGGEKNERYLGRVMFDENFSFKRLYYLDEEQIAQFYFDPSKVEQLSQDQINFRLKLLKEDFLIERDSDHRPVKETPALAKRKKDFIIAVINAFLENNMEMGLETMALLKKRYPTEMKDIYSNNFFPKTQELLTEIIMTGDFYKDLTKEVLDLFVSIYGDSLISHLLDWTEQKGFVPTDIRVFLELLDYLEEQKIDAEEPDNVDEADDSDTIAGEDAGDYESGYPSKGKKADDERKRIEARLNIASRILNTVTAENYKLAAAVAKEIKSRGYETYQDLDSYGISQETKRILYQMALAEVSDQENQNKPVLNFLLMAGPKEFMLYVFNLSTLADTKIDIRTAIKVLEAYENVWADSLSEKLSEKEMRVIGQQIADFLNHAEQNDEYLSVTAAIFLSNAFNDGENGWIYNELLTEDTKQRMESLFLGPNIKYEETIGMYLAKYDRSRLLKYLNSDNSKESLLVKGKKAERIIRIILESAARSLTQLTSQEKDLIIQFTRNFIQQASLNEFDFILKIINTFSGKDISFLQAVKNDVIQYFQRQINVLPSLTQESFLSYVKVYLLYKKISNAFREELPEGIQQSFFDRLNNKEILTQEFLDQIKFTNLDEVLATLSFIYEIFGETEIYRNLVIRLIDYLTQNSSDTLSFDKLNVEKMEELRRQLNVYNPILGDRVLFYLAANIVKNQLDLNNMTINDLTNAMELGKNLLDGKFTNDHDVQQYYRLIGSFIYSRIVEYINKNLESVIAALGEEQFIKMIESLNKQKFYINEPEGASQKVWQHIQQGNYGYLGHKLKAALIAGETVFEEASQYTTQPSQEFTLEEGGEILELRDKEGNDLLAHVVKMDPAKGGRAEFSVDVGRQKGGITGDSLQREVGDKGRLVFDAPVSFTTGDAKPTEIVIENGEIKNYLMTPNGKDGLIIIYEDGTIHIADKRNLKIGDLDSKAVNKEQPLDVKNIDDVLLIYELARKTKLSMVSNMLLYDGEHMFPLNDGGDQRRMFVEFSDGSFGVVNPQVNMSTDDAVKLAIIAGAKKVVYMDTGQFDFTTFRPLNGAPVVWGHSDQPQSSNRIGLYILKPEARPTFDNLSRSIMQLHEQGTLTMDEAFKMAVENDPGLKDVELVEAVAKLTSALDEQDYYYSALYLNTMLQAYGANILLKSADNAQLGQPKNGGIDFNPGNLKMDVQGEEIEFSIPNNLINVDVNHIDGFIPIMINVLPINNLPSFLGLDATPLEDKKPQLSRL